MGKLFEELKRRKVFRVAAVYAVVAWLLIEVAATVLPALQMPDWTVSFVTVLFILGFPLALVLAWAYEITPKGIELDRGEVKEQSSVEDERESEAPLQNKVENLPTSNDIIEVAESKPCIAVLPFTDMSQEHNQEWFSEGISEEILNGLAKIPQLKVIARTSSFALKNKELGISEIGDVLKASHVLEGSIRSSGAKIRVSTQLGNTSDGAQVWSEQYDDELTDVFGVQDKIAAAVLNALNLHLLPAQKKAQLHQKIHPESFKKFLRGRHYLNLMQLDEAIALFREAIDLDDQFADPFGPMARAHNLKIFFGTSSWENEGPMVTSCIESALKIDPGQSDALAVRASNLFFISRKYQESIDEFSRLLRIYPSNTTVLSLYKNTMLAIGRSALAIKLANKMVELDPLSPQVLRYRADVMNTIGDFDATMSDLVEAEALGASLPLSFCNAFFLQRNYEGIEEKLDELKSQLGENSYWGHKARIAYLKDDEKAVKEALNKLDKEQYIGHTEKAFHAFLLGDQELFYEEFGKAVDASEFRAIMRIHYAVGLVSIDPQIVLDDRYQAILSNAQLDKHSISELTIPELPF